MNSNVKDENKASQNEVNPNLTEVNDKGDFVVKNVMETIVWDKIDSILDLVDGCCKCEKCRNDIMAITLNNMPSKYVVTKQGELYSRINASELQSNINISTIITNAVMFVKDHPRHDK